jgi:hypothetical protein
MLYAALKQATADLPVPEQMTPSQLAAYQNKLQGRVGELLALGTYQNLGSKMVDINREWGMNMPNVDLVIDDHYASVKTYGLGSEASLYSGYAHALDTINGSTHANRGGFAGKGLPEQAANRLLNLYREGVNIAGIDENTDVDNFVGQLKSNSLLCIPDDHIAPLQAYIQKNFP